MAKSQIHSSDAQPQETQGVARHATQVESRSIWEGIHGPNALDPVTYEKTSVLILGWGQNADDTMTAIEVSEIA